MTGRYLVYTTCNKPPSLYHFLISSPAALATGPGRYSHYHYLQDSLVAAAAAKYQSLSKVAAAAAAMCAWPAVLSFIPLGTGFSYSAVPQSIPVPNCHTTEDTIHD